MKDKIVFVDIDDTLLDFEAYTKLALENGFSHFGLKEYEPSDYAIFQEINGELWRMIERGELTFAELEKRRFNDVFAALGIDFDGEEFERYFRSELQTSAIPVAGAYEMLEELSKSCVLCAASNGPYEQQMRRLTQADMAKYFDFLFISEKIGASKPSKEFFSAAFNTLENSLGKKIAPQDTLIVGDSLTSDIKGGSDFGMQTCYFNRNNKPLDKTVPTYIVEKLEKVKEIAFFD